MPASYLSVVSVDYPLGELYQRLGTPGCASYSQGGTYTAIQEQDGRVVELFALETLKLNLSATGLEQRVSIGRFHDTTRISFTGSNATEMRRTIAALHLPTKWPDDVGEKVFYLFRGHLKGLSGYVQVEQQIAPGNDTGLEFVLQQLVQHHSGLLIG